MKTLSMVIVAGVLILGAVSADAQSRMAGRVFDVSGEINIFIPPNVSAPFPVDSQVEFGLFQMTGGYLDQFMDSVMAFRFNIVFQPPFEEGAAYIEIPLGETDGLIIAYREWEAKLCAEFCFSWHYVEVFYFYAWWDGLRVNFVCIPTITTILGDSDRMIDRTITSGFLIGTESID